MEDDRVGIPTRTEADPDESRSSESDSAESGSERRTTNPKADWSRPIRTEVKAAESEVEVVKPATPDLQAVEACKHEEESKQANYHGRQGQSEFEGCYPGCDIHKEDETTTGSQCRHSDEVL